MKILKVSFVILVIFFGSWLGGFFDQIIGYRVVENSAPSWVVIAHNLAVGFYFIALYLVMSWKPKPK